jgi:hypothetical protein
VGDSLAGPIRHDQIDVGHKRQAVGALLPPLIEVGVAAPDEIVDVADHKAIAGSSPWQRRPYYIGKNFAEDAIALNIKMA